VPPPEEIDPTRAVLKVARTAVLLLAGAAAFLIGTIRTRRAALA
jgi:hypothetical protein